MIQQLIFRRGGQRAQAEQAGIETEFADQRGFGHGLPGLTTDAGDPNPRSSRREEALLNLSGGDFKHRPEQANLRITNGKLRRMHAHRQPSRARRDVVTEQRALTAFVEPALRIERERAGGNGQALPIRVLNRSIAAIAHLEMGRTIQVSPILFHPVSRPAQHRFQRRRWRTEGGAKW